MRPLHAGQDGLKSDLRNCCAPVQTAGGEANTLLWSRREFMHGVAAGASAIALSLGGCSNVPTLRSQSPEETSVDVSPTRLVGDMTMVFGMHPIRVEAVGLVMGLPNTGSDPPPSIYRAALMSEMQARGVRNPNHVLADSKTEMVLARGFMRPGIQKGDTFDIEVRVPDRNSGSSLRGGWLMETRLAELAVLEGSVRDGKPLALVDGPILIDPSSMGEDERIRLGRGRILGRAVSLITRPLGLVLRPGNQSIRNSTQIGAAVNRRFHTFDHGIKTGVAKPKTDEYIELKLHTRYKDNIERYLMVVRSLALSESAAEQSERIKLLERQLLDPITSSRAALRLEAIGVDAAPALRKGLESPSPEVRFYTAEALAYLDQIEAAAPLGEAARETPAFRAHALSALSAMDDYAAYEALRDLLHVSSAETRYGAFRALWAMNSNDPLVRGENLGGDSQFGYHIIASEAPPLIHVTRSYRAEVVLFGKEHRLQTPVVLEAGPEIMITSQGGGDVTVARFKVGQPDQKRTVSTDVDDVIRAIAELGGAYPDVVQALQQAKDKGVLASRFEIDAVPKTGRSYTRKAEGADGSAPFEETAIRGPSPELFGEAEDPSEFDSVESDSAAEETAEPEKKRPLGEFFDKISGKDGTDE